MHKSLIAAAVAAGFIFGPLALAPTAAHASTLEGLASYYKSGRRTANGERFNPMGLTAAHRSLPFGTRVRVTQVHTGRSVVVRINDRGPFVHGRIIDLSLGAAQAIGLNHSGVAKVDLVVLKLGSGRSAVDQMQAPRQAKPVTRTSRTLTAHLRSTNNIEALAVSRPASGGHAHTRTRGSR